MTRACTIEVIRTTDDDGTVQYWDRDGTLVCTVEPPAFRGDPTPRESELMDRAEKAESDLTAARDEAAALREQVHELRAAVDRELPASGAPDDDPTDVVGRVQGAGKQIIFLETRLDGLRKSVANLQDERDEARARLAAAKADHERRLVDMNNSLLDEVRRAERAEKALADAHRTLCRGDHGDPKTNARCLVDGALSWKEAVTERDRERDELQRRMEALADTWDRQRAEYPDTDVGQHAAVAVKLCARELRAALPNPKPEDGGNGG